MKILKFCPIILIPLILFNTCIYFKLLSNQEWMESSNNDDIDIHITGNYDEGGNTYACYWKNGELRLLTGTPNCSPYDIKIHKRDVYIVGAYETGGANQRACYWKNGELKTLTGPSGLTISLALSIIIFEDDIYICGYYGVPRQAVYWKNEGINFLPNPGANYACINELHISRQKFGKKIIYAAGYYEDGTVRLAAWKNDNIVMAEATVDSNIRSLLVKNGIVYLGGLYNGNAAIWRDFSNREIIDSNPSIVYDISSIGNDIHYVGYNDPGTKTATYWKNKDLKNLDTSGVSEARKISIFDDDIYIVGQNNNEACIWKNGQRTDLSRPSGSSSAIATGILVVRRIVDPSLSF